MEKACYKCGARIGRAAINCYMCGVDQLAAPPIVAPSKSGSGLFWTIGAFVTGAIAIGYAYRDPRSDDKPVTSVESVVPAKPAQSAHDAYVEQLDREIASLSKLSPLDGADVATRDAILLETALIGAWSKIYAQGKTLELTTAETAKREKLKTLISKAQRQRFPVLRKALATALDEAMWKSDVDVANIGRGLRFTGGTFVLNRNIAAGFEAIQETARIMRYQRVTFEWHRGSRSTYYDLEPLPDGTVAELAGGAWIRI